jgi:phosphatidylinositol alpha-1,6-mannosyltransferase
VTHLLVTNDFPPKVGGIQAYLWDLWSRLDPESYVVLTARSHPDAAAFDREQARRGIRIERVTSPVLAPTPQLARRIRQTADRIGAGLVVLDPVFPLGLLGPRLGLPYAVLLHGAEVAIPGRLPVSRQLVAHVLRHSVLAVSAGGYPAAEGSRTWPKGGMPPVV